MNLTENYDEEVEADIYEKRLAIAPIWYHYLVMVTLSSLGTIGLFLNGYVIGCFAFCPIVSTLINKIST